MMEQRNNILVIDGQNNIHRAAVAYEQFKYRGKNASCVFGFASILKATMAMFKPKDVYICWDGKKDIRRAILPTYKERTGTISQHVQSVIEQRPTVMKMVDALGLKQVHHEQLEGDDVIYWTVKRLVKKTDSKIIIVTRDKDFNQLLSHRVHIWDGLSKRYITPDNCHEIFGYTPEQTVDWLSLIGDDSDNIKGYRGIGKVKAKQFLSSNGSIINFINKPDYTFRGIDKNKLWDLYQVNQLLIDLPRFHHAKVKGKFKYPILNKSPRLRKKRVFRILKEHGVFSLMDNRFIKVFQ